MWELTKWELTKWELTKWDFKVGTLLVARLGLEGVDCLWHVIHTVPKGFLTTREKFVVKSSSVIW